MEEIDKKAQLIGYVPKQAGQKADGRLIEELTLEKARFPKQNYYGGQLQNDWPKGTKVIVMNKSGELKILFEAVK